MMTQSCCAFWTRILFLTLCLVFILWETKSDYESMFYPDSVYSVVKNMRVINTDAIERNCDKIKQLNRVLDVRYHIALEEDRTISSITFEEWAKACHLSVDDLDRIVRESELAKRELLASNRKLISRWLISLLPRAEVPLYDIMDFALNEIIIAADIYDPEIHENFETYVTMWLDESYKIRYEDNVKNKGTYEPPPYTMANINTNIVYSAVKYLVQREISIFLGKKRNKTNEKKTLDDIRMDEKNDIIYFIESTFHPVESNILLMQLGFYDDRSMSIQEIADLMEMSPDTVTDVMARSLKKLQNIIKKI